jgi:hypothetical protein
VRVRVLHGDTLLVVGHGSRHAAARALNEVATQVRKAINRMPGVTLRGCCPSVTRSRALRATRCRPVR